jgi:hypothetical protein
MRVAGESTPPPELLSSLATNTPRAHVAVSHIHCRWVERSIRDRRCIPRKWVSGKGGNYMKLHGYLTRYAFWLFGGESVYRSDQINIVVPSIKYDKLFFFVKLITDG